MSDTLSRRNLLLVGGGAAATPLLHADTAAQPPPAPAPAAVAVGQPCRFFTQAEFELVSAAVDRLIPPDEEFTGAVGAGVPVFIDCQLAGAYGAGHRLYRQGPFAEGTPEQGYQLPYTPAELYRAALGPFGDWAQATFGSAFPALAPHMQDDALARLESGEAGFDSVPSSVFFETLLANTIEGFFADPIHGGNRDMVGWRMVGFPGAFAGYTELVGRHNLRFTPRPRGIAAALADHGHLHAPRESRPGRQP